MAVAVVKTTVLIKRITKSQVVHPIRMIHLPKKEKEAFDWIEIVIDRIERAIERLRTAAASAYKSLKTRLGATADEIDKVNQEIATQQQAYDRYIKEANSVGLSSSLAEKVRNGTIDIDK